MFLLGLFQGVSHYQHKYYTSILFDCSTLLAQSITGRKLAAFLQTKVNNMKTIVLLTDFSEEAFRAAEYACEIAGCLQVKKIVLYNAHSAVVAFGGSTDGAAVVTDDNELYLDNMESLGLLQDRLRSRVAKDVAFEMIADNMGIPGIADWIDKRKPVSYTHLTLPTKRIV